MHHFSPSCHRNEGPVNISIDADVVEKKNEGSFDI